ncbi:MAG: ParB/RepB/Spo0J family partition protein [Clostridia bacterium]|nr:ParB/RepB/Spo0J family partition protein [Clostridia bacterium]
MFNFRKNLRRSKSVVMIPARRIEPNPHPARRSFNWNELEGLAQSIAKNGLLQPIVVRYKGDKKYELIFGERRLKACKMAGFSSIPCIIVKANDKTAALYTLTEALEHKTLNYLEEAAAIDRIIKDFRLSREEISDRLGIPKNELNYKLSLMRLPDYILKRAAELNLKEEQTRELLKLPTVAMMEQVLNAVDGENLNGNLANDLIKDTVYRSQRKKGKVVMAVKDVQIFINTFNHAVDTMKECGIKATSAKTETEKCIEYTVKIEKPSA